MKFSICLHRVLLGSAFLITIFLIAPLRPADAQPIILENDQLRVELSPEFPAADRYILKSNNQFIYGDIELPYAQMFYGGSFYDLNLAVDNIDQRDYRVCYQLKGQMESREVVAFGLCYILSGNSVELTFDNVRETPGYKLVVVRTPYLVTVRADQEGGKIVFPYAEGRLIDIATTTPGH